MRPDLQMAAAELLAARRARDAAFGNDREGFGEPAWDMLLHLTAHDGEADEDELLEAAGPAAIASRYLTWLTSRELVAREVNPSRPCNVVIRLQARAELLLTAYLENERTMT